MQSPVLSSTFFLTLLMIIGLVFFIRASTKERIEVVQWAIAQPQDFCIETLQQYFQRRSYCLVETDLTKNKQVFEGFVRPSVFLAILLFILATIGCLCLGLVLALLLPDWNPFVWGVVLLAPIASLFYWKKSSRIEQVSFKVEALPLNSVPDSNSVTPSSMAQSSTPPGQNMNRNTDYSKVTVMGHRDELTALGEALKRQSVVIYPLEEVV